MNSWLTLRLTVNSWLTVRLIVTRWLTVRLTVTRWLTVCEADHEIDCDYFRPLEQVRKAVSARDIVTTYFWIPNAAKVTGQNAVHQVRLSRVRVTSCVPSRLVCNVTVTGLLGTGTSGKRGVEE